MEELADTNVKQDYLYPFRRAFLRTTAGHAISWRNLSLPDGPGIFPRGVAGTAHEISWTTLPDKDYTGNQDLPGTKKFGFLGH